MEIWRKNLTRDFGLIWTKRILDPLTTERSVYTALSELIAIKDPKHLPSWLVFSENEEKQLEHLAGLLYDDTRPAYDFLAEMVARMGSNGPSVHITYVNTDAKKPFDQYKNLPGKRLAVQLNIV